MPEAARPVADESVVLVDGPWTHRTVSANGIRFHVAELGTGPLVLLLHGFPQFWWSWRRQLVALADHGFRAAAADLRGYGASDKPPRGYDLFTLADDVAGLVRALGERTAVLVGQDWGGGLAWATAVMHPPLVRGLGVVAAANPLSLRTATLTDWRGQLAASRHLMQFQLPWQPERWLVRRDAVNVGRLLRAWAGAGWPDSDTELRYRRAMQIPGVAHSSVEYHRWAVRSQLRRDGHRFAQLTQRPVTVPTVQIHGAADSCVLPSSAAGSRRYVTDRYDWTVLAGVGHFPAEEQPTTVNDILITWLDRL